MRNTTDQQQPDVTSLQNSKKLIRKNMLIQRQALSLTERQQAARQLHIRLMPLIERLIRDKEKPVVGVFAPFRDEITLELVFTELLEKDARLCFPKTDNQLKFYMLPTGMRPEQWLQPGHFGVPEPATAAIRHQTPVDQFDLMLLPGLAFDQNGGRLGWGKAYYDQFLTGLKEKPWLIGVGYSFQLLTELLPTELHDQKLHFIVTPDRLIDCQKRDE